MKTLVLLGIVAVTTAVHLPPNFQKCNRKEPNFNECVFKAAQNNIFQMTKAYDEVGLPNVNPFELSEARISGGSGPVGLEQIFRNCKFYGFNELKLDKFVFDFEKKTLDMSGIIPEVRKLCNYEMNGKILLFQVNGKGNSTIVLKNLRVTDHLTFEELKKSHKTYMKFLSSSVALNPELVTYHFESSINKELTDTINPVLNEHWKEIFDDVKSGYEKIIDEILMNLANRFFGKVSMEEAFD